MKFPKTPMSKLLPALLLALTGTTALASDGRAVFGPAAGIVAQFNAEERRAMRERWEEAGPEERLRMRREFKERLRHPPPESGRDRLDPWRGPASEERDRSRSQRDSSRQRDGYEDDDRFGMGFERRRFDEDRIETPAPQNFPNPGGFFERRRGRDGNRP